MGHFQTQIQFYTVGIILCQYDTAMCPLIYFHIDLFWHNPMGFLVKHVSTRIPLHHRVHPSLQPSRCSPLVLTNIRVHTVTQTLRGCSHTAGSLVDQCFVTPLSLTTCFSMGCGCSPIIAPNVQTFSVTMTTWPELLWSPWHFYQLYCKQFSFKAMWCSGQG